MARRKESMTVYMRADQVAMMRHLQRHSRIPMAVMIRDAVDDYIDAHGADRVVMRNESTAMLSDDLASVAPDDRCWELSNGSRR